MTALAPVPKLIRSPRAWRTPIGVRIAIGVVAVSVLAAVSAPLVAPYDPTAIDLCAINAGISPAHVLGTDGVGRDLASRLLWGARTALLGPLLVVIGSTGLGILLGLVAAWRGGWVDALLSRVFDVLFSFPALLLAIMAIALFGKGLTAPVLAMCLSYAPLVARLTRSLVRSEKERPYVAAYRVAGFSGTWIAFRRVLPNILPVVGAQSTLNFGYVLAELAALSFLGLGVQPPTPDWGAMTNEAQAGLIGGAFLPAFVPATAVVLVVVAINVIGERLSERIGGTDA